MDFRKGQPGLVLDGEWQFAFSDREPQEPEEWVLNDDDLRRMNLPLYPATVPGNFELDLQANGLIPEPFYGMNIAELTRYERCHIWYTRRFHADPPPGTDAFLLFEGVDCISSIRLNGVWIGATDNMLTPFLFPIKPDAENVLVVHIKPAIEEAAKRPYPANLFAGPNRYESLFVRKAPHMYGWDIMPRALSAGLWRPVRLLYLPQERFETAYLETLSIAADCSSARMTLHFDTSLIGPFLGGDAPQHEIEIEGRHEDSSFTARERLLFSSGRIGVTVHQPHLWWPKGRGDATLYDVTVRLLKDGETIDTLTFTHGIRTTELIRTSVTDTAGNGEFCFRINGEKVFVQGSNWVPVDAYHSRDRERIPAILEMAEDLNCNMLRCWGGNVYEDDLFYETCDRKGIMIWQDFAMACAVYPQSNEFREQLHIEVSRIVRRLRQHACIVLWAGDNECDQAYEWGGRKLDPNANLLTRVDIPSALQREDQTRPYLPSSPYIDPMAFAAGQRFLPENHLWGPRDYYKSDYYTQSLCHFASEIGYHGCPSPESLRKFLSPERVWPYQDNPEWILHSTSPIPGVNLFDYRVELMAKQVRELFGEVPANLEDFAFASQASQAEAKKFFIEMFRSAKWRRTGILWWNLMDGWPQLSDAIVDYYFEKKLAYDFIKRSQASLCLVLREPANWSQEIVACNDMRQNVALTYTVQDIGSGETVAQGEGTARADAVTVLGRISYSASWKRFYLLRWTSTQGEGVNHYLAGNPPFALAEYRDWLQQAF